MKKCYGSREKTYQKASFTIEAACLLPVLALIFIFSVWGVFYYHDKNILSACAYETAVVGSTWVRQKGEVTVSELEAEFQERIKGKCILFENVQANVQIGEEQIIIQAYAQRREMEVKVSHTAAVTEPEAYIRKMKKK